MDSKNVGIRGRQMPHPLLPAEITWHRASPWPALLIIAITLIGLAWVSSPTKLLNCDMECGESVLAVHAANQFAAHGIQHGLLENVGTPERPLIYTHNVDIGTLTFVGLEALGVAPPYKFLLPLAAYGLGLLYVYLVVRRASGSELCALITLGLFATCYWGLGAFALNALRSWHLFAFFAVIFHTIGLARGKQRTTEIIGLTLAAAVAFGCGYDFWIICGAVSGMLILSHTDFSIRTGWNWAWLKALLSRVPWQSYFIVAGAFAAPFLLRQAHVAYVMGTAYWAQDFYYSFAIKVPYADRILTIPPLSEIDAYYNHHHVLRPPAQPGNTVGQILYTLRHMITSITVPRWGCLSLLNFLANLIVALCREMTAAWLGSYSARLIAPVTIGSSIGLAIFAPFSLHVYFKHEFPLIAFPLLLAKGALLYWLLTIFIEHRHQLVSAIAVGGIAFVALDAGMVHWNNSTHGPALNFGWSRIFAQLPHEKIALTTYRRLLPDADPFVGIDPKRAVYVTMDEMLTGRTELRYWVYQPTDRFVDFDSANPRCEWTGWLRQLVGWKPTPQPGRSCIYGFPLPVSAIPQPSLTEIAALAAGYDVVERNDRGIGYIIFRRKIR
jgi:hypothetical protein